MLKYITPMLLTLVGCIQSQIETEPNVNVGVAYGEGVVSDDPPGADDWNTDSDSATDTSAENTMTESYTDCANDVGEDSALTHPCNFQLLDQNGDLVELYDLEGDVIMVDFSTMWCVVCKMVAEDAQELHDKYDPFTLITILTEDTSGNSPTVENLEEWANYYGITSSPVLGGDNEMKGTDPGQWNTNGLPCFFFIDKDFYVRYLMPGWNEERATGYIESLLDE